MACINDKCTESCRVNFTVNKMLWHNLKYPALSKQPRHIDKLRHLWGGMVKIGEKSFKQLHNTFGEDFADNRGTIRN